MTELELKAKEFATRAHLGQKRKYTGEDYIVHPEEVAGIVRSVPHTEAMLAAAWLHDTVEDTAVTLEEIQAAFGSEVAGLVSWLTDVSKKTDGNRHVRKAFDLAHTSRAPAAAKTVKLADLISNSKSITQHDPKFAKVYLREKDALLEVLTEGDPSLLEIARTFVRLGIINSMEV